MRQVWLIIGLTIPVKIKVMKRLTFVITAIALLSAAALAQEKLLTLDDIFSPDPKVRVAFSGTSKQFPWSNDGRYFKQAEAGKLVRVDAVTGASQSYFESERLERALQEANISAADAALLANSANLRFNSSETAILIEDRGDIWHYSLTDGALKRLTNTSDEEKEADFSPNGQWVSFVRGNNLFVVNVANGTEKQLTRDGSDRIFNGYLDWVYEEELYGRGNKRGYWWSPDSNFIAFLRLDESPVPKFVLPNDIVNEQVIENTDYPKAGDPNPIVRLGIADVNKRSRVPNVGRIPSVGGRLPASVLRFGDLVQFADLKQYKPEDLLIGRVAWTPDSRVVLFQAQNREQTFLDMNAMARDGKVQKLFTETSPAWVSINDNPSFLQNGTMVWQSERNGWNHIYLYDTSGKLIRQLTDGKWEVRGVHGVDRSNGWIYFSATKDSHIAENIYRVKADTGAIERLTEGDGHHSASFNSTFTHFVDNWSDVNTPPRQFLYSADGKMLRVLNENKVEALNEYKLSPAEFLKVKTRDGFEMEAMMIRPPNFDANRRYPVMSYTYAGPHAPSVRNAWGGSRYMWHQMLAQKGYIVWVLDNRTASGKGQESTWPVYKDMGRLELRDLEDGVNYLKSLKFVDPERIGIYGWSYGGYMTTYALTHSVSFKIGIAGGSVTDWHLYDSIYTERYMMTPQNNPDGYERSSVLKAAKNLHGRLLLIHGAMDDNVHMQNTMKLAYELQKAGKQFDLMIYPTQRHGISDRDQVRHWYQMMTDFILKNL